MFLSHQESSYAQMEMATWVKMCGLKALVLFQKCK